MVSFSPFRTPTSARLLQLLLILLIPHLHFFYHYPKITSSNAQKRLCCYQCSCFHCQLIAVVITALHWHLVGNSWKVQKGSPQAAPGERALLQACLIPRTSHRSSVCVCVCLQCQHICVNMYVLSQVTPPGLWSMLTLIGSLWQYPPSLPPSPKLGTLIVDLKVERRAFNTNI